MDINTYLFMLSFFLKRNKLDSQRYKCRTPLCFISTCRKTSSPDIGWRYFVPFIGFKVLMSRKVIICFRNWFQNLQYKLLVRFILKVCDITKHRFRQSCDSEVSYCNLHILDINNWSVVFILIIDENLSLFVKILMCFLWKFNV